MFDEFIRELKRLEQPVSVPIDLPLDDKGYFDRRCSHTECQSEFKVLFDDWRVKVPDDFAFCPKCGERAEPSDFNTPWQQEYIEEFAHAYMSQRLNEAFGRAARRTRPKSFGGGLINMQMSVSYKAGHVPVVLPPSAADALRQDLTCETCGCRYSTIGAGYFCPACGHNSPLKDFERTIEMARKTVEGLAAIKQAMEGLHDPDTAANFEQQLLEDQIENLVTAFQRGTEALFARLPNASSFKRDANLFQRLSDGSALWKSAVGTGYDDILDAGEMASLQIMIHRRHKFGHCQGIVDAKYVQQSGDGSYVAGQRLVTNDHHVLRLANVLEKLMRGLTTLVP
jgi:hypothetical protein